MDPRFQTSFIPKKPIVAQSSVRTPANINLFALIATVIFVTTLAVGGAAFFYERVLAKQIESDKASLERARGAFDPELIAQIVRFDTRIETARKLIEQHVSVGPLFQFVADITLPSVRFNNFEFSYLSPEEVEVSMTGQAKSYASVALQSDVLNDQKNLTEVTVGDMDLGNAGDISFSVTGKVNPALLRYSSTLTQIQPASTTPLQ